MKYKFNPYLTFEAGQCREAFALYERAFGGKAIIKCYGESSGFPTPEEYKDLVIHARLDIGTDQLMGADHIAGFAGELNVGNNFSVCVYPDSLEACEHLMQTLSEGGRIVMPFEKQFFGYML